MGARNLRRNISPLHTEMDALIWRMHYMIAQHKRMVAFVIDSKELVQTVEAPSNWPAFDVYLEELERNKAVFSSFSLSYIPILNNSKSRFVST